MRKTPASALLCFLAAACVTPQPPVPALAVGAAPLRVPDPLFARTRLEPSALLARPSEGRYLLASDDTGRAADEGQPWLFAMSPSGALDAEPIPVRGVRELTDVEAIAEGSAGEVYLLSSQSYSKKGKRKSSRTALLRLRPSASGFEVDGEIHLAEALDADGDLAAALGLPGGTRGLDIEGLAFDGGALYFGLKAPLDAGGSATIWRASAPDALFDAPVKDAGGAARLRAAGLSPWASVRVGVEVAGAPVPGGISDLVFDRGALLIASTPSVIEGEGGAVWVVDNPHSGALSPRLLRRFPGKKPEGLAPSLTPGKLMIVFDTGDQAPLFQEIPWGA